ncbi:hypothetical protein M422DRAFT_249167 [Sphaerobolus stellatus SS14]|nr:hypothetical protein M422DRAFT_249167 [Sphaerobolus stellatus SS14]
MTDLELPAHMLAWKTLKEVVHMEEVLVGNPRSTVKGFQADKKFDRPAPKFSFDDPYEKEEDRLPKVRNQERTQRESRFQELLDAEMAAATQAKAEEMAKVACDAKEKDRLEKEQAVEKEKEKEKDKEVGPSGSAKGKAREVPRTPKETTPKKLESEEYEAEDEDKPQSHIYCVKKKIPCVPQVGKKVCVACRKRKMKCEFFDKIVWAIMDGSKQIADSMRELVGLERRREAGRLEGVWYDLQKFMMEVEQWAVVDSVVADAKLLQLLELKSKGVEILADLEKQIHTECGLVQDTLKEHTEDLTERMDVIQKCMAWTKNGFPKLNQECTPVPLVATQGTKRKGDNEGNRTEGSKKKKKKKVVETEEESSTLRWGVKESRQKIVNIKM